MSAKLRITAWITLMMLLLAALTLVFVLVVNHNAITDDPAGRLVKVVQKNVDDVEFDRGKFEWDDLSMYSRGVYCMFYDTDGEFIRGAALVGDGCVVGNSVELKNCILFDGVQVPHYNYVGDSVLGYKAHMGAGAVTSNVKSDRTLVSVRAGDEVLETRLKKMGAILGDRVEVGCNSVLNPGTVVGADSNIYPLSSVRGTVPSRCILKSGKGTEIVEKQ